MDTDQNIEFLVENATRHEVQLQRIRDLIEGGMKVVISSNSELKNRTDALIDAQLRTETAVARMADAQANTERALKALIDSLRRSGNGHDA